MTALAATELQKIDWPFPFCSWTLLKQFNPHLSGSDPQSCQRFTFCLPLVVHARWEGSVGRAGSTFVLSFYVLIQTRLARNWAHVKLNLLFSSVSFAWEFYLDKIPNHFIMGRFGSQTSTYNRLVTVFVAIGSMVSPHSWLEREMRIVWADMLQFRRMVTALQSFPVLSVNQDGILTSTYPRKASLDTIRSQLQLSRLQMAYSVLVVLLAHCS